jgi:mannose-6-phosphate isomerase class I
LSIQVHPNDAKKRHNSFGKTEMWYIMADQDARIIVGFKEDSNADEYLENLKGKKLLSILDSVNVKEGDAFFLETGTVHAIERVYWLPKFSKLLTLHTVSMILIESMHKGIQENFM